MPNPTSTKNCRLPFHYAWLIVICGSLTLFCCFGLARFAFGMLLPGMRQTLELSYAQMGYLGTGNFFGYLLSIAATPWLVGRLRPRLTIVMGLLLIVLSLAFLAVSQSYLQALFCYAWTGFGSGLANIASMVLIAYWFERSRRGRAAGLMVLGNGIGIILSGLLVPWLSGYYAEDGWRIGWGLVAVITAVILCLVGAILRNRPEAVGAAPYGPKEQFSPGPVPVSHHPGRIVIQLGLLYMAFGLTYMVYASFVVTSMVEEYGFSQSTAGQFWSWVGFFGIFSGVLFGILSDHSSRKAGLMAVFAVQTIAYLLAGSGLGVYALWGSVFCYGICAFAIPAIMAAAVSDYLGVAKAATGFSLITFFFAGGQTIGPALAGILAEHSGHFSSSFLLCGLVTFLAALFCLTLPRLSHD